jgi:hypothetical protein
MPDGLCDKWKTAKNDYQRAAGGSKPPTESGGTATGIASALQKYDDALKARKKAQEEYDRVKGDAARRGPKETELLKKKEALGQAHTAAHRAIDSYLPTLKAFEDAPANAAMKQHVTALRTALANVKKGCNESH